MAENGKHAVAAQESSPRNPNICPHLGSSHDPETALAFPTSHNYCHSVRPPLPVKTSYQQSHCLTTEHFTCPVYRGQMPAKGRGRRRTLPSFGPVSDADRKAIYLILISLFLLLALASLSFWGWRNQETVASWLQYLPLPATPIPAEVVSLTPEGDNFVVPGPTIIVNTATSTPSPTPTETSVPSPTAVRCSYPDDWIAITVTANDTLASLARMYDLSVKELVQANCLRREELVTGSTLYVPEIEPSPTATTATATPSATAEDEVCQPPSDWVVYIVQPGDNLFRIGLPYGLDVNEIMEANCLQSRRIRVGQRLYVPDLRTSTPTPTIDETAVPPTETPAP